MEWTDEFRDEMKQRQLAKLRYTWIALLVLSFLAASTLGYIWLTKGILSDIIVLIALRFSALPIPLTLTFQYLLRYDFMVRPTALITLCTDIIYGPFFVYVFRHANIMTVLFFPTDGSALQHLY